MAKSGSIVDKSGEMDAGLVGRRDTAELSRRPAGEKSPTSLSRRFISPASKDKSVRFQVALEGNSGQSGLRTLRAAEIFR